jgi:mannosyl-glycoprotein endo-beta-N-acetylglucosaminidase
VKRRKKTRKKGDRFIVQAILFLIVGLICLIASFTIDNDQSATTLGAQLNRVQQYNFIREIAGEAQAQQAQTGLKASITLAQACVESDFGRSLLSSKYNNLFGIKAYGNEPQVALDTKEYEKGKWYTIIGNFRTYSSWSASISDHTALFVNGVSWNPNLYQNILTAASYQEAANNLQTDGYATDPNYSSTLIATIEQFNLSQYD